MGADQWKVCSNSPEQTQAMGESLARLARPGLVVALCGDLGAGKTCFSQGVGIGLDLDSEVVSPTFTLMVEHPGALPLLHIDTYRLGEGGPESIGLEEEIEGWSGVVLVEWADRFPEILPLDHLRLTLQHSPDSPDSAGEQRIMHVSATGPIHTQILSEWRDAWLRA